MPVWLQLTASLSAALTAGLMGKALIPFLRHFRWCEPEDPEHSGADGTASGGMLRPTMCGILLVLGCTCGMVLTFTLCSSQHLFDRTDKILAQERTSAEIAYVYAVCMGVLGFLTDAFSLKKNIRQQIPFGQQLSVVAAISYVIQFQLLTEAAWYLRLLPAAGMILFWYLMQGLDRETDGMTITSGGVQLLLLTVLFLRNRQYYFALLALCAAGACMGCMVWNLHPAKCKIGHVGSFWTAGMVSVLCAVYGSWKVWLLMMAGYLLNRLPLLRPGQSMTLLQSMEQAHWKPWQRIALLTGFIAFCGILGIVIQN